MLIKTIPLPHIRADTAVTIRDFRQLRELELVVTVPKYANNAIFSSINSIELQKVVFQVKYSEYDWMSPAQRMEQWTVTDEQLCGLVDRLHTTGYRQMLEVELRLVRYLGDPGEYDFTRVLPGFREKGVVAIIDVAHGDRILHSSAAPTQPGGWEGHR